MVHSLCSELIYLLPLYFHWWYQHEQWGAELFLWQPSQEIDWGNIVGAFKFLNNLVTSSGFLNPFQINIVERLCLPLRLNPCPPRARPPIVIWERSWWLLPRAVCSLSESPVKVSMASQQAIKTDSIAGPIDCLHTRKNSPSKLHCMQCLCTVSFP